MEFKKWDKKSKINGVEASVILSNHKHFIDNDVVLFIENETVKRIEDVSILKDIYNIETDDALEIARQSFEKMEGGES